MLIRLILDTLVEHWGSAAVRLGATERRRVGELVRRFAAAPTAEQRRRAARRLAEYACSVLPPEHPVAAAGAGIDPSGRHPARRRADEVGDADWTALAAALARLAGGTVPDVRARLRAAPALTVEQLRLRGGDPGSSGLIRLDFGAAGDGGEGDAGFCEDCAGRGAGREGGVAGRAGGEGAVSLPVFQFDPAGRLLPEVRAVNDLLDAGADPWGVADWWLGPNAWLDAVPADLVGRGAGRLLLEAARAVAGED